VTAATEADDTLATPGPAFDPTTGRLPVRGTDASGAFAPGDTAPLFP
jgi:hypothetical protein